MTKKPVINKGLILIGMLMLLGANASIQRNLQAVDPNCNSYNSDGSCAKCSYRYYFNSVSGLCEKVDDMCKTWSQTTGDCTSCYMGYTLSNGQCGTQNGGQPPVGGTETDPNCQCFDNDKNCITCYDGYYLNVNGQCVVIPDNCVTVDNTTGDCIQCADGFLLVNGSCQVDIGTPSDPCIEYGYVEIKCSYGYHCKWYNKWFHGCKKVCIACAEGYYLDSNNQCQQLPDNCLEVNVQTGQCTQCQQGYAIGDGGICLQVPENCVEIDPTTGNCTTCADGFELNDQGQCDVAIGQPTDPCAEYGYVKGKYCHHYKSYWYKNWNWGKRRVCIACIEGYYLDPNNECQLIPENCDQVDVITGLCIDCANGYTLLNDGTCILTPENCLQVDLETGNCTQCADGFELNNQGLCDVAIGLPDDPCAEYKYVYQGKWHNKWIHGCKKVCVACIDGYYLDSNNECQVIPDNCVEVDPTTGFCTQCVDGYYANSDGVCVAIPDNCLEVDPATGDCTQCAEGFQLNDQGQCDVAVGVPSDPCAKYGFIKKPPHAYNHKCRWHKKYYHKYKRVCIMCIQGYYLDPNYQCQPIPDNCEEVDVTTGQCTKCSTGFSLLNDGTCIQTPENCIEVDPATGNCTTCADGFELNAEGLCDVAIGQPTDPCTQYAYVKNYCGYPYECKWQKKWFYGCMRVCIACAQGYYLDNNHTCQLIPDNCLQVDPQTGVCTTCEDGFTLTLDGICIEIPENCVEVDTTTGLCITCADGFQLNDQGQCAVGGGTPSDTCAKYGYVDYYGKWHHKWFHGCQKVCIKCIDGYYLDNNNQCQLLPDNCVEANSAGECVTCADGFELNDQGQCDVAIGAGECTDFSLCKTLSADGTTCTSCYYRAYLDTNSCCVEVDGNCKYWNQDGTCVKCYYGYIVNPDNAFECISA